MGQSCLRSSHLNPKSSLQNGALGSKIIVPPEPLDFQKEGMGSGPTFAKAYLDGSYTLEEAGRYFGVIHATVSPAVKRYELDVKCKA